MAKRSKKKKKQYKFLLLIIVLLLIISLVYYFYIYKKGINYKTKITIEIGENIPIVTDYVSKNDIEKVGTEIVWTNLSTEEDKVYKVGEYIGTISYNDEVLTIKLVVEDTTAPVIEGTKDIEMLAYEIEPDLLEGITVTDNSLEELKVTVEGEYDTEKAGTFPRLLYSKSFRLNVNYNVLQFYSYIKLYYIHTNPARCICQISHFQNIA